MMKLLLLALPLLLAAAPRAALAQTDPPPVSAADSAAIRRAALDYIEGWYTADAERMARAVHPDLAKRAVDTDKEGENWLYHSGADGLIRATRRGMGTDVPPEQRRVEVVVLDVYGDMATVRVISTKLVDYMHLAKFNGEWKIVNVLWGLRPGATM